MNKQYDDLSRMVSLIVVGPMLIVLQATIEETASSMAEEHLRHQLTIEKIQHVRS